MRGIKHLIQCHCILPQFRKMKDPIFHKFVVFTVIDNDDNVLSKIVHCNNCGVVHNITDVCESEIVTGREMSISVMTKEDIRASIPENIAKILDTYECDIPVWEEVQFYYETGLEAPPIVLTREEFKGTVSGKIMKMLGGAKVKIESFTRAELVENNKISYKDMIEDGKDKNIR